MKKFGKLRQWTDEKLGSTQKTMATEEFRDLEAEMLLRQQGLEAMLTAIIQWMRALGKKKEGQDKEKGTPLELLGIAMVNLTYATGETLTVSFNTRKTFHQILLMDKA